MISTALMLVKEKNEKTKKWRLCQRQSSKFTTLDHLIGNGIPHHRFCDANHVVTATTPSRCYDEQHCDDEVEDN